MSSAEFSRERLARMHAVMSRHVDSGAMPGLVTLVSRRDEVHIDAIGTRAFANVNDSAAIKNSGAVENDGRMRRDTIFRIASMSKPITAVAAMILIEECKLRLDDAIDPWLPELADRRVLRSIDAPLDDTVPARRAISVRDLLTFRLGFGSVMAPPDSYPIQTAMRELRIGGDGPPLPAQAPDTAEWLRRLASLPLMYQPGERWLYNTGSDVLSVLIERVAGQPFAEFLRERIFGPLDMRDTGFYVPREKLSRFTASYIGNAAGSVDIYDGIEDSQWRSPPPFASGAGGLVSTAVDYFAFCRMLLNQGRIGPDRAQRILSRPSVELMTSDQLTPQQKIGADIFFNDRCSWGFGMAVYTRRDDLMSVPGRFGWDGGLGTSAYTDPREQLIGILLTQRMMDSPEPPRVFTDFWTSAYQAIDA